MTKCSLMVLAVLLGCASPSANAAPDRSSRALRHPPAQTGIPAARSHRNVRAPCRTVCKHGPYGRCNLVCGAVIIGLTPDPDHAP